MLKRIATAVVLIPIVLVLILRAPVPVLAVVAGVVALLTIHEFLKLTESYGVQPLRVLTYTFCGIFFLLLAFNVGNEKPLLSTAVFVYCLGFAAAVAPFVFLTRAMRNTNLSRGYPAAAASVFAFTYIALPMGMLAATLLVFVGVVGLFVISARTWGRGGGDGGSLFGPRIAVVSFLRSSSESPWTARTLPSSPRTGDATNSKDSGIL